MVCSTSRRFLSGGLRRQFDSRVVSAEPRRDSFFFSVLHCSEDSPLGGGSVSGDFPTVFYLGLRVDAEAGGLQGFVQEVAGVNRPVCNISKSQMFHIFFSLPRSQCYGDGCASSKLEWVAGVCLSSLVSHSGGFDEAPVVLWSSTDHRSSILASEAVVSGSSGSGGRRPGRSSTVQRPSASAPLPPVSSGSVQAVSSCLETMKRFTRTGGFSGRVAQQVSLAQRPSSRAGYQSKWLVLDNGVDRKGIPFLALPCLRLLIFCFGFKVPVDYQYLLLWAIGPCCLRFLDRFCRRFLHLRCFMICCGHFRLKHQFGRFVLLPGI